MQFLRSFHWFVTGLLFIIAIVFYLMGLGTGAVAFGLFGVVVETVAWLSFAGHPSKSTDGDERP